MSIKFGTDGWRGIIAKDFTFANLTRITIATAKWLKAHHEYPQVMIGYDCRFMGKQFAEHAANILAHLGCKVFLSTSFASSPMVSMATFKRQADLGIVITASHNAHQYSGYKLKGPYGSSLFPDKTTEIEALVEDDSPEFDDKLEAYLDTREIEYFDMNALYINHCKEVFDFRQIKKSGIKIAYDAMYGAGQGTIRRLLPHSILIRHGLFPDFKGIQPEPIPDNLTELSEYAKQEGISLGLATDGDADRIAIYDENGQYIDTHHIILLMIQYLTQYHKIQGKVVVSFSCSSRIEKLCKALGIEVQITPIGFKHIAKPMVEESVIVGGEESGGVAISGHIPERDGIFVGLSLIDYMLKTGKTLSALVKEVHEITGFFSYKRINWPISLVQQQHILQLLASGVNPTFKGFSIQTVENIDGYKYHLDDDSWVMIRASGTEPVLRLYAESGSVEKTEKILKIVSEALLE